MTAGDRETPAELRWLADVPPGQIVLLNGASSSGKSSIATELLDVLPQPWFHLAVDAINGMRARRQSRELSGAALDAMLARTRAGYHRAVAALARAGSSVVADHVLSERWRLLDCLDQWSGLDVVFVGVRCAPAELERRERARGDRDPGTAAAQQDLVHDPGRYDLVCDTTVTAPRACALAIRDYLAAGPRPRVFTDLRASLLPPPADPHR